LADQAVRQGRVVGTYGDGPVPRGENPYVLPVQEVSA